MNRRQSSERFLQFVPALVLSLRAPGAHLAAQQVRRISTLRLGISSNPLHRQPCLTELIRHWQNVIANLFNLTRSNAGEHVSDARKFCPRKYPGQILFNFGACLLLILLLLAVRDSLCAQRVAEAGGGRNDLLVEVKRLSDNGEFKTAEELVTRAERSGQNLALAYISRGYLEFARQQLYASSRAYRRAEQMRPNDGELKRLLAVNYYLLDQKLLFKEKIAEALNADSTNEQSYYVAGRFAYEVEEDFAASAKYFSKAVALDPGDYKAHYYLGQSDSREGKSTDAQKEFERASELVDSRKDSYDLPVRTLAENLWKEADYARARAYAQRAIVLQPKDPGNYYMLARIQMEMEKYADASESLLKAVSCDPTYVEAYYLLGRAYSRMGESVRAAESFDRFKSLRSEYDGK